MTSKAAHVLDPNDKYSLRLIANQLISGGGSLNYINHINKDIEEENIIKFINDLTDQGLFVLKSEEFSLLFDKYSQRNSIVQGNPTISEAVKEDILGKCRARYLIILRQIIRYTAYKMLQPIYGLVYIAKVTGGCNHATIVASNKLVDYILENKKDPFNKIATDFINDAFRNHTFYYKRKHSEKIVCNKLLL